MVSIVKRKKQIPRGLSTRGTQEPGAVESLGRLPGQDPLGMGGTCEEGDRIITGIVCTFFVFFFFFETEAAGSSEDPSVNFLKNVGESVAAALSPLGKWWPLSFESSSVLLGEGVAVGLLFTTWVAVEEWGLPGPEG